MTFRRSWPRFFCSSPSSPAWRLSLSARPPPSANSIERIAAYQDQALLARAWALPVARLYGPNGYLFQQNPSICGPTSIADVLRSEGVSADPADGPGPSGQVARLRRRALRLDARRGGSTSRARDGQAGQDASRSCARMRSATRWPRATTRLSAIIVNFTRAPLFGRGHGHFSPVLGYLPAEDLVFVGDVNANYRPWLVPTSRLFEAQNTIDSSSHAKRGVLEVDAQ